MSDVIKTLSVTDIPRKLKNWLKGGKLFSCLKISSEKCVNKNAKLITKRHRCQIFLSILPPLNPIRWKLFFSSFQLFSVLFAFIRKFGIYCQNKHTRTHTPKIVSKIKFINKFCRDQFSCLAFIHFLYLDDLLFGVSQI